MTHRQTQIQIQIQINHHQNGRLAALVKLAPALERAMWIVELTHTNTKYKYKCTLSALVKLAYCKGHVELIHIQILGHIMKHKHKDWGFT